jgi:CMP-N-acetylneuraminic acid synthetase
VTVVALIGARSGSKGIPGKNVRAFEGHPLLAWSVAAGLLCPAIDRVVVSTDSPELAAVAERYGAEAPFLRPAELSRDDSVDLEYVRHAIERLGVGPDDLVVLLRPTTPVRDPALLADAVADLRADPAATGLLSAHELPEPPQKMLRLEGGSLVGCFPDDPRPESFNLPRQAFPAAYHHNGYVDVLRVSTVLETGTLFGPRIRAFVTDFVLELDRPEDFEYNAQRARREAGVLREWLDRQAAAVPA